MEVSPILGYSLYRDAPYTKVLLIYGVPLYKSYSVYGGLPILHRVPSRYGGTSYIGVLLMQA